MSEERSPPIPPALPEDPAPPSSPAPSAAWTRAEICQRQRSKSLPQVLQDSTLLQTVPQVLPENVSEHKSPAVPNIFSAGTARDSSPTESDACESGPFMEALNALISAHEAEIQAALNGNVRDIDGGEGSSSYSAIKADAARFTRYTTLLRGKSKSGETLSRLFRKSTATSLCGGRNQSQETREVHTLRLIGRWKHLSTELLKRSRDQAYIVRECWDKSETQMLRAKEKYAYVDLWADACDREACYGKGGRHQRGAAEEMHKLSEVLAENRSFAEVTEERTEDAFVQKFIMKPCTPSRLVWSFLGLALLVYDLIVIPLQSFKLSEDDPFLKTVNLSSQMFWSIDMVLSFFTGYYSQSELEMRFSKIWRAYLSSWFAFDLFVVVPMWLVLLMGAGGEIARSSRAFKYIRMVRFLRLLRFAKFNYLLQEAFATINSQTMLVSFGIIKLMIYMCLLSHVNSCLWFAVGDIPEGWTATVRRSTLSYKYLTSMHWALTQFQGTSEIIPGSSTGERLYAVCTVLISLLIFSTFVSSLTNMMMQLQQLNAAKNQHLRAVINYLRSNNISSPLSLRVKKFVEWTHQQQATVGDDEVRAILPPELIMDLHNEVRSQYLAYHTFFATFRFVYPRLTRRMCSEVLMPLQPAPDEIIFVVQETCNRMYFVTEGELTYNHKAREGEAYAILGQQKLMQGKIVSEPTLWTVWLYHGELVTGHFASLLCVGPTEFANLVGSHPQALVSCAFYAKRLVHALGRVPVLERSDLLDPSRIINEEEDGPCYRQSFHHSVEPSPSYSEPVSNYASMRSLSSFRKELKKARTSGMAALGRGASAESSDEWKSFTPVSRNPSSRVSPS